MPEWTHESTRAVGRVVFTVRREAARRMPNRLITANVDGWWSGQWIVEHSKWEGHCNGQLLLPTLAKQATEMASEQFDPCI